MCTQGWTLSETESRAQIKTGETELDAVLVLKLHVEDTIAGTGQEIQGLTGRVIAIPSDHAGNTGGFIRSRYAASFRRISRLHHADPEPESPKRIIAETIAVAGLHHGHHIEINIDF